MLAALAKGRSRLRGLNAGRDSQDLCGALQHLGWQVSLVEEADQLVCQVVGSDGPRQVEAEAVEVGEGGSTLRFLLPLLAAASNRIELRCAPGLRRRPQQTLVEVLRGWGVPLELRQQGFYLQSPAPQPHPPTLVSCQQSSQFWSGLLMASGRFEQDWLEDPKGISCGYWRMTMEWMRRFRGADVLSREGGVWHQQAGFGHGQEVQIPSDPSAAVFLAVAAFLLQTPFRLQAPWSESHPDAQLLRHLAELGVLQLKPGWLHPTPCTPASSLSFDLGVYPDSGPALAVLAAHLPHGASFSRWQTLRGKESNRVEGMQRLAELCGARCWIEQGQLWVHRSTSAAREQSFDPKGDHRLAMAAGVASLLCPKIEVLQPECVAKSWPNFWQQFAALP